MRILNEQNEEIQESEVNTDLGYLYPDQILKEHHEAIEEVKEQGHYYPQTFYFEDGTRYDVPKSEDGKIIEDDAHVSPNEDGVSFTYVPQEDEEDKEVRGTDVAYVIDVEHQDAKDAWDEMEDIQRYKLYTKEQLEENRKNREEAERRENFMATGPDRLNTAEVDITGLTTNMDDITMLVADMIGVG